MSDASDVLIDLIWAKSGVDRETLTAMRANFERYGDDGRVYLDNYLASMLNIVQRGADRATIELMIRDGMNWSGRPWVQGSNSE